MVDEKNTDENTNDRRREFLKTASKVAVYTPPTLLMLMNPSFATFTKSAGGNYDKPEDKGRKYKDKYAKKNKEEKDDKKEKNDKYKDKYAKMNKEEKDDKKEKKDKYQLKYAKKEKDKKNKKE